mmetsp:Transcript_241/g.427  ORF Transcript_241/g.427 Transcript_241/m.427 type:complete len:81 (+) Transcript_241:327-569(+)
MPSRCDAGKRLVSPEEELFDDDSGTGNTDTGMASDMRPRRGFLELMRLRSAAEADEADGAMDMREGALLAGSHSSLMSSL